MARHLEPPLRAVTFDFWNTLIRADYEGFRNRRLTAWLGLLAGEGFDLDRDVLKGALGHGSREFERHWMAGRIYTAEDAVADMLGVLGIAPTAAFRAELLATITDPDPAHDPAPTDNVADAIGALRERGIKIGIICDVGLAPSATLRRFLTRHDLIHLFDHWSFSDEVGVFKPDPAIFAHALAGLGGVAPTAAAHVGDLRRTDVAGAQQAGWFAVRYTGAYDDPGSAEDGSDRVEADAVIADHLELLAALGL